MSASPPVRRGGSGQGGGSRPMMRRRAGDARATLRTCRARVADAARRRLGHVPHSMGSCIRDGYSLRCRTTRLGKVRVGSNASPAPLWTTTSNGRTNVGAFARLSRTAFPSSSCSRPVSTMRSRATSRRVLPRSSGSDRAHRTRGALGRGHRPGSRLPMGRRLRTPALVVHGPPSSDPAAARQLRSDLGRHPSTHTRERVAGESREGRSRTLEVALIDVALVRQADASASGYWNTSSSGTSNARAIWNATSREGE
jgi:hypothetical protein